MAKSEFGERLKIAFDNAVNAEIANKIGVSEAAVGTYVRGRIPDGAKLVEISKLTNCNLHWLLTGDGPKYLSEFKEFDLEYAIDQHEDWVDVVKEWYEFEGETMPDTMGASFMGGWRSFDKQQKMDAIRDFKAFLDRIKDKDDD